MSSPGSTIGTVRAVRENDLSLLIHQIRYEQLSFLRNTQAVIFTFAFPVLVILILGVVFSGGGNESFFFGLSAMQYYTPTIAAVSVLGACYSQLAIMLAMRRQTGILKRLHATPLPAAIYFAGLLAHCVLVSIIDVALIIGVGSFFGVPLPTHWGAVVVTLMLGATSFCALGVGVASLIRNAEAAPAVVQFIQLPLVFISGNYFPIHSETVNNIAGLLPVKPFNDALLASFTQGAGFQWTELGVLLGWGVLGTLVAVRRFRWDPRPE